MAETDWTELTDGLDINVVDRGVTNGIARPPGGGSFLFGFNSLSTSAGAMLKGVPIISAVHAMAALSSAITAAFTAFSPVSPMAKTP